MIQEHWPWHGRDWDKDFSTWQHQGLQHVQQLLQTPVTPTVKWEADVKGLSDKWISHPAQEGHSINQNGACGYGSSGRMPA
jgi:hypothetical protein